MANSIKHWSHAERALEIANETRRPLDVIFALHRLGRAQVFADNKTEALGHFLDAIRRTDDIDAPIFSVWFACDAVPILMSVGMQDDARNLLNKQVIVAEQLKLDQFLGWLRLNKASIYLSDDRLAEAEAEANAALHCARSIGDLVLEPVALKCLAQLVPENERTNFLISAHDLAQCRGYPFLLRDI